ncbi:hypothetical protein AAVH_28445 [Aphelenchoides avenae]|nr:hypothetical protein AAVH_28445 [Aphelenchus avenae]
MSLAPFLAAILTAQAVNCMPIARNAFDSPTTGHPPVDKQKQMPFGMAGFGMPGFGGLGAMPGFGGMGMSGMGGLGGMGMPGYGGLGGMSAFGGMGMPGFGGMPVGDISIGMMM